MSQISKEDIAELKKRVVVATPAFVKFVLELLMVALGTSAEWKNAVTVLNRPELVKQLKKYDAAEVK